MFYKFTLQDAAGVPVIGAEHTHLVQLTRGQSPAFLNVFDRAKDGCLQALQRGRGAALGDPAALERLDRVIDKVEGFTESMAELLPHDVTVL